MRRQNSIVATYLFGWNPKLWNWPELNRDRARLARQGFIDIRWSSGRVRQIEPGSRAFFVRLGVPPTLARTLRSTNCIESMISIARTHSVNVKNWQNGTMALRWCAAGMIEARGQFRRVNGHLHLPVLRAALERHVAEQGVSTDRHDENVNVA